MVTMIWASHLEPCDKRWLIVYDSLSALYDRSYDKITLRVPEAVKGLSRNKKILTLSHFLSPPYSGRLQPHIFWAANIQPGCQLLESTKVMNILDTENTEVKIYLGNIPIEQLTNFRECFMARSKVNLCGHK